MSTASHTCPTDDMDRVLTLTLIVATTGRFVDCGVLPLDTVPKHGSGQGFRYEVRYPPAPRTTGQDGGITPETPKFQQYSDGTNTHLEDRSLDTITELPSELQDQFISCGEELNKGYGDSENHDGYEYIQPSNKLSVSEEHRDHLRDEDFPDSALKKRIFTDPSDPIPEGSEVQEVPWLGEPSHTLSSDTLNLKDLPSKSSEDHQVPGDQESAPETYSSVRFTGSFFTEEGLPVLGNSTELPVDYRFEYLIRGIPDLGHEEARVEDTARGRYWVLLPDGRVQEVSYVADSEGYRPTITYRQPGQQPGVELS